MKSNYFCRSVVGLAFSLVLGSAPGAAFAGGGNTVTAESLFQAGQDAMKAGDFKKACDNFAASQKADPAVGTLLSLGTCNEKQGNIATAWATYIEASSLAHQKGDNDREQVATERANGLKPKLSKLTVNMKNPPPGLVITRDGIDLGEGALGTALPIDPGQHVIEATAKGFKKGSKTVDIGKENDNQTIEIPALEVAPPEEQGGPGGGGAPAPSGPNTGLMIGGGVVGGLGVVGLIVGAGTGAAAASGKSTVDKLCPNKVCSTQAGKDKLSSTKSLATVSTIGLAAGGVLAAAGGVMLIIGATSGGKKKAADEKASIHFVPSAGPQGAGGMVFGSF
jgi:hypothetical protein